MKLIYKQLNKFDGNLFYTLLYAKSIKINRIIYIPGLTGIRTVLLDELQL
jgi:hypothetical protein